MNSLPDPIRVVDRPRRPWSARARTAAVIVAVAGLILLAAACGGSSGNHVAQLGSTTTTTTQSSRSSTTSAGSLQQKARASARAFSRCMRSHSVQNFPDPDNQGNFPSLTQQALGVPKQTSLAAQQVCEHLLSSGGTGTPQQRQQKLAFGVKVAQCLRTHGFPTFPDPTRLGPRNSPPGIDLNSPRFQAAETNCEKQAQKALDLP